MSIPYPRGGGNVCGLDKFGVSIDGDQGQGPLLMPKVKYRWRVLFVGLPDPAGVAEPLTLNSNSVTIPTVSFETQQMHSYNSRAYYAGKHEWGTSSMVFRDTYDNTVSRAIGGQLQRQLNHYNQTGFRSAADYKFKAIIQQLDGGHDSAVENIHLCGCFFENVDYGDLDYSNSEARTITVTIRPDNVIIEGEGAGEEGSIFLDPGADPLATTVNT